VNMLFACFGCIELPECSKWLIRVCCLLNLPFNPRIRSLGEVTWSSLVLC
jgi:hypothetical protein